MTNETTNHYYICEITGIPKKLRQLVAWRLINRDKIIKAILSKVMHGEI